MIYVSVHFDSSHRHKIINVFTLTSPNVQRPLVGVIWILHDEESIIRDEGRRGHGQDVGVTAADPRDLEICRESNENQLWNFSLFYQLYPIRLKNRQEFLFLFERPGLQSIT